MSQSIDLVLVPFLFKRPLLSHLFYFVPNSFDLVVSLPSALFRGFVQDIGKTDVKLVEFKIFSYFRSTND